MTLHDPLGYEGKKIIVTGGGGQGMGAATVEALVHAGAEVHVLDFKEPPVVVASHRSVDLKDPTAMYEAVNAIGPGVDALFNCVGVPGTRTSNLDTFLINFAGVRHLTESVVENMNDGGAIATIASVAGRGWEQNAALYNELLETPDFDSAAAWFVEHPEIVPTSGFTATAGYRVSKEAVTAWAVLRGPSLGARQIRHNALMPGFTETPMSTDFRETFGDRLAETHPTPLGSFLRPDEPAKALLFLNSPLASGITGSTLMVDGGSSAALRAAELLSSKAS
ncbi:SDR family oxidoreductase [Pseudarthrobacter sp. NPDC058196]|uniref:SDR family oxidoreductase n=1 Tax=Pseudarthrobacter sp. NPDC058196 TaxID=3346376 RepID=UPI0036D92450